MASKHKVDQAEPDEVAQARKELDEAEQAVVRARVKLEQARNNAALKARGQDHLTADTLPPSGAPAPAAGLQPSKD